MKNFLTVCFQQMFLQHLRVNVWTFGQDLSALSLKLHFQSEHEMLQEKLKTCLFFFLFSDFEQKIS